jgi:hypothetical protein
MEVDSWPGEHKQVTKFKAMPPATFTAMLVGMEKEYQRMLTAWHKAHPKKVAEASPQAEAEKDEGMRVCLELVDQFLGKITVRSEP